MRSALDRPDRNVPLLRAGAAGDWILPWLLVAAVVFLADAGVNWQRGRGVMAAAADAACDWPAFMMSLASMCMLVALCRQRIRRRERVTIEDAILWTILGGFSVLMFLLGPLPLLLDSFYTYDDLGSFHLPVRAFYSRSLAAGDGIRWWPQLWCGFDVHAEGQGGFCHPWHRSIYGWLPLQTAFVTELVASFPMLFLGMFLFLRRLGLSVVAAAFGAFTFSCSGPVFLRFAHLNAIAVLSHLPWLLLLSDVAMRTPSRTQVACSLIGISVLTGSQLLLGYPQYVLVSVCAEALYVVTVAVSNREISKPLLIGVFKVLGVGVGAVQIWPTWCALANSTRGHASLADLAVGSLPPINFVQYLFPYLFRFRVSPAAASWQTHEFGIYAGLVPLLFCVLVATRGSRKRIGLPVVFSLLLLGLSSLVALGEFSPLFPWIARIPLVGSFRVSSRFMVLAALAIAILGAAALDQLIAASKAGGTPALSSTVWQRRPRVLIGVGFTMACVIAGLGVLHRAFTPELSTFSLAFRATHLVIAGSLAAIWFVSRHRNLVLVGLVLFHVADLLRYDGAFLMTAGASQPGQLPMATMESLAAPLNDAEIAAIGPHRIAAVPGEPILNRLTLKGVSLAMGYVGLPPSRSLDLSRVESCRAANVARLLENGTWRRIDDQYGEVWIGDAIEMPEGVTLQRPDGAKADSTWVSPRPDPRDRIRMVSRRNEQSTIDVSTERAGMLVWSESYHPGWRVEIDGRPAAVEKVCGDLLGCSIVAGSHLVQFIYRPREFDVGLRVTVATTGLLFLLGLGVFVASRRLQGRGKSVGDTTSER